MKRQFLFFVINLNVLTAVAQISFPDVRTCANVSRYDVYQPFGNAATLAYVHKFEFSGLFQNRYAEKEFSTAGAQMAVATKPINIGAGFVQYGFLDYHEQIYSLGLARKIGKRFSLSVQADYYSVHYSTLSGGDGKFLVQVGFIANPVKDLYIGFQAFNPIQTTIKTEGLTLEIPSVFALGLSYWFTPKVVASAQCEKDIYRNFDFTVEADYALYENFRVKAACVKEGEIMPAVGCGVSFKSVSLDTNFKVHTTLGVIPEVALTYALK